MRLSHRSTSRSSELSGTGALVPIDDPTKPWEPLGTEEGGNNDDGQGHASEDDPEL